MKTNYAKKDAECEHPTPSLCALKIIRGRSKFNSLVKTAESPLLTVGLSILNIDTFIINIKT